MTSTVRASTEPKTARPAGTSVAEWGIATAVLFVLSLVVGAVATGSVYSSPFADDAEIQRFYAEHGTATTYVAFVQFLSALTLVGFSAAIWSRMRALTPDRPTHTYLAAAGGLVAAAFLAFNAVVQWVLSFPGVIAEPAVRRGFHLLFFGLGGFAHVAALGLLVGGVSLAGLRTRTQPRWFAVAGLVVAGLAVLSSLTFLSEAASTLIPLGRFPSLIWLIAVGFVLLPRRPRAAR